MCVGEFNRNIGCMPPSHRACFSTEVFHINIKEHVAFYKLESMWNIPVILQSIEGHMDILHFFSNGIQQSIAEASSTELGRRRPYLCVFFKYLILQSFANEMIASCLFRIQKTHQLKLSLRENPIFIANPVTWTGSDSLRSDSFSKVVELSFY